MPVKMKLTKMEKAITDQPQEVGIDGFYCWEIKKDENLDEPPERSYLKGINKDIMD